MPLFLHRTNNVTLEFEKCFAQLVFLFGRSDKQHVDVVDNRCWRCVCFHNILLHIDELNKTKVTLNYHSRGILKSVGIFETMTVAAFK